MLLRDPGNKKIQAGTGKAKYKNTKVASA